MKNNLISALAMGLLALSSCSVQTELPVYLDESRDIALRIAREIRFIDDDRRAADHCNMMHPEWPPIGSGTARAMRIPVERS